MTKAFIVEKTLQIIISEEDLNPPYEKELTEDLALEIAKEIGDYEWQQVDLAVVGTPRQGDNT